MNENEIAEEQTKALPIRDAYRFGADNALEAKIAEIRGLAVQTRVRKGLIVQLFRDNKLLDRFIDQHWAYGKTPGGEGKLRFYERQRSLHIGGTLPIDDPRDEEEQAEEEQAFVLESQLRDYLAHNMSVLEPGLQLYEPEPPRPRKGVEFEIDQGQGFIDILAKDKAQKYVVIELKLSRGRNRALGQLLYYMGWVDKHLGSEPCRGMIIAANITEDLITAARRVSGISLFSYKIAMSVQSVSTESTGGRRTEI